jgi:hypothetical protein
LNIQLYVAEAETKITDNTEDPDRIVVMCLDVLHVARCFIFVARLVAANRTHLIFVIVVLVGVFSGISAGVLLYVF